MAGFKTFTIGEVLTAANVNDFLMKQSVMVFADAAARTAALGAEVAEGMLSYNEDTGALEVYDGVAWAGVSSTDAGDLTSGTLLSARLTGSYTGITGTGALDAGSVTSGFGNVDIGSSTFTGNGSGLTTLNATNVSSGTLATARFPAGTLVKVNTATIGTNQTTTSASFQTSITKSYTPTAAGNLIVATWTANVLWTFSGTGAASRLRIQVGGSTITGSEDVVNEVSIGGISSYYLLRNMTMVGLYTTVGTSAVSFTCEYRGDGTSGITLRNANSTGVLTIFEVKQ